MSRILAPIDIQVHEIMKESGDDVLLPRSIATSYLLYSLANERMESALEMIAKYRLGHAEFVDACTRIVNDFNRYHDATKFFRGQFENGSFTHEYSVILDIIDSADVNGKLWNAIHDTYKKNKEVMNDIG